uniref:Polyamine transporter PUT1 n=1 Tax=Zea mays TaxID=4577 RepID=A0A804PME2_MAIZE
MGECRTEYRGLPDANGEDAGTVPAALRKVSIVPLVFLIFYEVSGGPFGIEDSVGAAGPLLAIVGFLVLPVIWSIPEALITAELGTMFPENGGYVVWVASALGPYWGFQQGGLTVVGWVAICLGVFSILPFFVMGLISLPRLRPARWLVVDLHNVDWNLYLNTLFWNLNYWDSISTLSGEVDNPGKTLPKALFYAVIFVVVGYLYPLLAGTGAVPLDRGQWSDGYFSDLAKLLGGAWLMWWVQAAAALSNMGMFVAEMSSDSYQLLGMAERGMLPAFFARRSRHGTPLVGILFSASGVLLLSSLSFEEIVAAENFLYCFGMLLEFIAFVLLRVRRPDAPRPYRVPLGTAGCVAMLVPPTALIVVVLALSTLKVALVSLGAVAIGLVLQPALRFVETKGLLRFAVNTDLPDIGVGQSSASAEEPVTP